jgi:hypothetical protein
VALTFSGLQSTVMGNRRVVTGTFTWDSSYADNGEALTPANLGLSSISFIQISPSLKSDGSAAVDAIYDYTNQKVIAVWSSTGAVNPEVTATTDLSTYSSRFLAFGN